MAKANRNKKAGNSDKMAFVPGGVTHNKRNTRDRGDNFKPFSNGVESLDSTPNYNRKSDVMANTDTNSKSNTRTGGRIGGDQFDRREAPQPKGFPIWAPRPIDGPSWQTKEGSNPGYNIDGQGTPTMYDEPRDTTLFKTWNTRPSVVEPNINDAVLKVQSYTKVLDIDLDKCFDDEDYKTEWNVAFNIIYRSVLRNTNASKGTMDKITQAAVRKYLHEVSRLYSYLYEYEVITTWNPDTFDQFNSSLRDLCDTAAGFAYMEQRNKMRLALRPHILPGQMMKYLRWLHEYKRMNYQNETVVTAFRSPATISLMDSVYNDNTAGVSAWINTTNTSIDAVNALDRNIPAILMDKCDSVRFQPVENWMGMAFRGTSFDAEYNNIYCNRTWCEQDSLTDPKKLFPSPTSGSAIVALNTETPFGLSLANLSFQINGKSAGLPLEANGGPGVAKVNAVASYWNHFITYQNNNVNVFRHVSDSYENGDNSNYTVNSALNGIVIPRGDTVEDFYPSKENIGMAKRRCLSLLFQ